jgi:hypothetical protein
MIAHRPGGALIGLFQMMSPAATALKDIAFGALCYGKRRNMVESG